MENLSLLIPQKLYQNRLLHVEAVFCLVKQLIRVGLKDLLRDLLPPGRPAGSAALWRRAWQAFKSSSLTWKPAKAFILSSFSFSWPMDAQVSVYTTSASFTASMGLSVSRKLGLPFAASSTAGSGW